MAKKRKQPEYQDRVCKVCNKTYHPTSGPQKCCSDECKAKYKEMVAKGEIQVPPKEAKAEPSIQGGDSFAGLIRQIVREEIRSIFKKI